MQSYIKQSLCNADFKETNFMKYDYRTIYYLSQGYLIATSPTSYKCYILLKLEDKESDTLLSP